MITPFEASTLSPECQEFRTKLLAALIEVLSSGASRVEIVAAASFWLGEMIAVTPAEGLSPAELQSMVLANIRHGNHEAARFVIDKSGRLN